MVASRYRRPAFDWDNVPDGYYVKRSGDVLIGVAGAAIYSDENAQDAVGTILLDSATIDFTYDDATPSITAIVIDDSISNAKLRNSGALSVIGRSANSAGDPADISASAASDAVLRESGSVLGFGTIATGGIANDAVTYAKIQNVSTDRLLGRDTAGSGDVEELTVGGGIEFTGATGIQTSAFTGDVTKAAGGTALTIANDAVTFAKMQNVNTGVVIGRTTAGVGDPEEITFAALAGLLDHGGLVGLGDDDHAIYLLLAGRAGGQTAYGGTAASENLNLNATAHATKGTVTITGLYEKIAAGDSLWVDAANRNLFFGSSNPGNVGTSSGTDNLGLGDNALGAMTTASQVVAFGSSAAESLQTAAAGVVVIGYRAARVDTDTESSVVIGATAAASATAISDATIIGFAAAPYGGTGGTVVMGAYTGFGATSAPANSTFVGGQIADTSVTPSNEAAAFGFRALKLSGGATGTSAFGAYAGQNVSTGSYDLLGGYNVAPTLTTAKNCVVFGAYEDTSVYADVASASVDGQIIIAGEGQNEIAERFSVHVVVMPFTEAGGATDGNTIVGSKSGNWRAGLVAGGGSQNALFGANNAPALTSGIRNLIAGTANAASLTTGARNIVFGYNLDVPAAGTNDYLSLGGAIFGDISANKTIRIGGSGAVSQTERLAVTQATADTSEVFSFETTSTNGAKSRFYVGDQNPNGTITANPGSVYFRVNGTSSSVWSNTGAGSGTTWTDLAASGMTHPQVMARAFYGW